MNRQGEFVGSAASPLVGLGRYAVLYRNNQLQAIQPQIANPSIDLQSAYAINDTGAILALARINGNPLVPVLLRPRVAASPTGLTFSVVGRTVTLAWVESPGATDYALEAGSVAGASDVFNGSIGAQPALTAAVPPGRYFVRLRARNAAGISAATTEIIIDVP